MLDPALTVLTHHSAEYAELAELTLPNKRAYANDYGHHLNAEVPFHPRGPGWSKVKFLMEAPIEPAQWFLWMGCDAMFIRPEIDITQFCDPAYDLILCRNGAGQYINSDVFLARATMETRLFFTRVWDRPGNTLFQEQDAMTEVLREGSFASVQVRTDRAFNAFPEWSGEFHYRPGDFIAHAAGLASIAERIKWLRACMNPVGDLVPAVMAIDGRTPTGAMLVSFRR